MTTAPEPQSSSLNDKDKAINQIDDLETNLSISFRSAKNLGVGINIKSLNIYEINEILSSLKSLNKDSSLILDRISQYKMTLVDELRLKTRQQLGEET